MKYFAYGSNMLISRLQERVPSAVPCEKVILPAYQLCFDKISHADGSGKCGIIASDNPDEVVYGIVFDIDEADLPSLDRAEGLGNGYEREEITIFSLGNNAALTAITYIPTLRDASLKPFDWYKALVVEGLKQHDLPSEYIKTVEAIEAISDPNKQRAEKNWQLIQPAPHIEPPSP